MSATVPFLRCCGSRLADAPPARLRAPAAWAGLAALLALALLWGLSARRDRLLGGRHTWVPCWTSLGLDFRANYDGARLWLAGGNPHMADLPHHGYYPYPPVVLPLFAWCGLLSLRAATLVWLAALAGMATVAACLAWRTRCTLGLTPCPLPVVLAALLGSTPVLFALERGNCDLLALLLLVLAVAVLRRRSAGGDVTAGSLLALGAWLKIYPVVWLLGLLALRRGRAALWVVVAGVALGLFDVSGVLLFAQHSPAALRQHTPLAWGLLPAYCHSLSGAWPLLWTGLLAPLSRVPGTPAAWLVVLPGVLAVSFCVWRCPQRARLTYPYLVWLAGAASFLPLAAYDYKLFYLPLAALMLWDRHDPPVVHVLLAYLLLWWQPFYLPIETRLLLGCKLAGAAALGLCLIGRARALTAVGAAPEGWGAAAPLAA
jgi:hypothetical protein